ncbi:MAG: ribonuclease HI family protein [Comamonadaceae bacterium]|nr:MAG: ribonuclease HI family protein [Comamonadaceae bacterium]
MTASPPPSCWVAWCDGSAVPNPGRMGLGVLLVAPDGSRHAISQATHTVGCNNEAELRALMAAVSEARTRGATTLQIYSDNSVVVSQLRDALAEPIARLAPLFDEARMLLNGFDRVSVEWVPRHRNRDADALARAALGMAPKVITKPWKRRR